MQSSSPLTLELVPARDPRVVRLHDPLNVVSLPEQLPEIHRPPVIVVRFYFENEHEQKIFQLYINSEEIQKGQHIENAIHTFFAKIKDEILKELKTDKPIEPTPDFKTLTGKYPKSYKGIIVLNVGALVFTFGYAPLVYVQGPLGAANVLTLVLPMISVPFIVSQIIGVTLSMFETLMYAFTFSHVEEAQKWLVRHDKQKRFNLREYLSQNSWIKVISDLFERGLDLTTQGFYNAAGALTVVVGFYPIPSPWSYIAISSALLFEGWYMHLYMRDAYHEGKDFWLRGGNWLIGDLFLRGYVSESVEVIVKGGSATILRPFPYYFSMFLKTLLELAVSPETSMNVSIAAVVFCIYHRFRSIYPMCADEFKDPRKELRKIILQGLNWNEIDTEFRRRLLQADSIPKNFDEFAKFALPIVTTIVNKDMLEYEEKAFHTKGRWGLFCKRPMICAALLFRAVSSVLLLLQPTPSRIIISGAFVGFSATYYRSHFSRAKTVEAKEIAIRRRLQQRDHKEEKDEKDNLTSCEKRSIAIGSYGFAVSGTISEAFTMMALLVATVGTNSPEALLIIALLLLSSALVNAEYLQKKISHRFYLFNQWMKSKPSCSNAPAEEVPEVESKQGAELKA